MFQARYNWINKLSTKQYLLVGIGIAVAAFILVLPNIHRPKTRLKDQWDSLNQVQEELKSHDLAGTASDRSRLLLGSNSRISSGEISIRPFPEMDEQFFAIPHLPENRISSHASEVMTSQAARYVDTQAKSPRQIFSSDQGTDHQSSGRRKNISSSKIQFNDSTIQNDSQTRLTQFDSEDGQVRSLLSDDSDYPTPTAVPLKNPGDVAPSIRSNQPSSYQNDFVTPTQAEIGNLSSTHKSLTDSGQFKVEPNQAVMSKGVFSAIPQSAPVNSFSDNQFDNSGSPVRVAANPEPIWVSPQVKSKNDVLPKTLINADKYVLADQPQAGDHYKNDDPITDSRAHLIEDIVDDFSPTPTHPELAYEPVDQMNIYQGKSLYSNQRPILELGRPWYQLGQLSPGYTFFGKHNNITPQFLLYGDYRVAAASNTQNGNNVTQIAHELNLEFDLKITSTERFHWFMAPLDNGAQNTRYQFDDDRAYLEYDADIDFGYFEGDMGAIVGGAIGETLPFDLPFAVGVFPLIIQNGVYLNDAFLGAAVTVPARNSAKFDISNMDFTLLAGFDKITSDAFPGDDSAAKMYGFLSFIEALNGYFEIDYLFFDDRTAFERSYHNIGFGYSRRLGRLLSHSTRIIVNAGQSTQFTENTADGVLLLSENSLITRSPSTFVPYFNFFAGFDRPQSAARAGAAGGVLANTGILFESDGITGYPTLDATANDAFGGAIGLNILAKDFSQQLILEIAGLGVHGNDATRNAPGAQGGVGFRYQLPITNAALLRFDGMVGFLEDQEDVRGIRVEYRHKW
ncbi:MAG: hypothetical protein AAF623_00995 [Planctomycetota bacterium]